MTTVLISNDLYGDSFGVLRSINDGGCIVAMGYMPPIGTSVAVHFVQMLENGMPGQSMSAQATVYELDRGPTRVPVTALVVFKFTGEWS